MTEIKTVIRRMMRDVVLFAQYGSRLRLRDYQVEVARAIVESVVKKLGLTFVVVFPRQSGKNELQAQIECYLLTLFSMVDAEMVKISPTWRPQTLNAMRRLERVLERNQVAQGLWKKESGYIYKVGRARIVFLSGAPSSNVVGATASTLLECDEAQDVLISKWDKDVAPMAASTNATRVFWGTAWTSRTLLARELRAAREAEQQDGRRRVWVLTAAEVAKEVPTYGKFVEEQIGKLGRNHPLIKTQYFSEEIDAEGGMFPPARKALMQGDHLRREWPYGVGRLYALLVDVAGEDELSTDYGNGWNGLNGLSNPGRDATALTVVEVDLAGLEDEGLRAPIYRVVDRRVWVGVKHTQLYGQLLALFEHWRASYLVVDATGVGAGLCSFLEKALGSKVIRFEFNGATKSRLGWDFLAIIETGRYREYRGVGDVEQGEFWRQVEYCQMEIVPGPERRMKWGVPEGTREAGTGERVGKANYVHDDLVISAALVSVLDGQTWGLGVSEVVAAVDPMGDLREVY